MTEMHLSECFMNTSTIQKSVHVNRLLGDGHHGWKWFWDFQWHFIPRALVNWVSNILKSFGNISAKLTNEKKSNNPCIETASWSKYVEWIASFNVLKRTNSNYLKLTIIFLCVSHKFWLTDWMRSRNMQRYDVEMRKNIDTNFLYHFEKCDTNLHNGKKFIKIFISDLNGISNTQLYYGHVKMNDSA